MDCVEFLLGQCHVPHDPRDRWGNMPIDEAETFGHFAIVDYLKAWDEKMKNNKLEQDKVQKDMANIKMVSDCLFVVKFIFVNKLL